jgi:TP901 family phage tail tape measure protein|nr:MAG TPA: tail tape measure protein [Caudoviricetes sp.]
MSLKIDRVQLEIVIQQDQARQKMMELEEKMRSANRELQKTKKQFGETSEEYKQQANVLKQLQQEYDNLYEEIGLTNLSLRDLGKRQKDLNAILRQLNPNTELYKQYSEQLKEVNNRIKELRGTANETRFSLSKLTDGFNKYGAIAASAIAGLTGITLTMRSCVNEYAEMEEAQSQVIKYTGLAKDEVKELNEEFKQMDTRTARTRLNELAGDVGKLGISTKEGVKEFVEAADMINVALGEDLGKEAITQIGKLADMFGDGDRSLKENMLSVGSAVNAVAQNSSAAEPYLVEFTARMGGVGKQANMAITDIMGFASALDQNMLRSEMASTALSGLILKLYQEPAKYAKLAGLQVEEFTKLMSEDVNEAVLTFLEALNRMGGMDKMAPVLDKMSLSGAEAASVISALAGNVDKVRKEQLGANQAFVEGTSVVNEFNVQNSTVQAELDKAKKRFADIRVELGEQLLPVMKYMVSTGSLTVKGLSTVISIVAKYKTTISALVIAITAYTVAVNASNLADKAKVFWTNQVTVAVRRLFNVIKSNPYTAVMALVTGLVTLYYDWNRAGEKLTQTERNLRDIRSQSSRDIAVEKKEVTDLLNVARDESVAKETRLAAIRRLNEISPEYLGNLDLERIKTEDAAKAVDLYVQSLITKQNIENANQKKTELLQQRDEVLKNGTHSGFVDDVWFNIKYSGADVVDRTMKLFNGYGDQWAKNVKDKLLNSTVDALKSLDQQLADVDKFIEDERNKLLQSQTDVNNGTDVVTGDGTGYGDVDAIIKKKQDELSMAMTKEQNELKLQHQLGLIEEDKYQSGLYDIQVKYLTKRKNLLETYKQDSSVIEGQLLDAMIAESNRKYKKEVMEIKSTPEPVENPVEDTYALDKYKQSLDGQLALLEAFHDAGIISEMEYQDKLTEINRQKEEERTQIRKTALNTISQLTGSVSQLMSAMQDKEITEIENRYDKQIEVAEKAGKDTTELEEQKEQEILNVKKKYADKQFAMNVLDIIAKTAVAIMAAWELGPILGPIYGAIAAAQGAMQLAVANAQREQLKGLYTGGYSDDYVQGYTAKGDSHDVAGVIPVHKNEFVTNHEGVANPHVKQFLDVFDVAQKNGTIGMLNTTQILQQVRIRNGRYSGGYTDDTTNSIPMDNGGFSSSEILAWIKIIVKELQKSNVHLSAIAAKDLTVNVRSVRDGIKRLEMLEKNASR